MKQYASFFFGVTLMTCLHSACAQNAPETEQPQLKLLDTPSVSLGQIDNFEVKCVPFHFTNTSVKPVTLLSLNPSCSCVRGVADKMQTPPGEEMVVTLIFNPETVHGSFERTLWVNFDDPAQRIVRLNVYGEVLPLFTGLPTEPIALQSQDTHVVWTNRFTLVSRRAEFRLGTPQIETNSNLQTGATLVTNASDNASYDLTLIVAPLALGRHATSVTLPVEGGRPVSPVRIDFRVRAGQALAVSPNQVNLYASGTSATRRFLVRTDETDVNAASLTWEPHFKGLEVQASPAKHSANLLVTMQFSPEAIKRVRAEKNAQLLFHYPKHTSAAVQLVVAEGNVPEPEEK
ncbi:MAG: DUF1573 domain-containing protein [bacterium]